MQVPGIIKKTTIRTKRTLMIYVSAFFFMFAYTIFAYSIASFLMNRFPENPNAILFVGFIFGISAFFVIFIDSLWAYMQKIKPPRTLTIWAILGVIFSISIFLFSNLGDFVVLKWMTFTLLATFLYGWSFDLYDITVSTTIINHSPKEKLAQNISQKKVAESLGVILGLITAGVLVNLGEIFTQFILLCFLVFVAFFFAHNFDNEEYSGEQLEFSPHALIDWKAIFSHIHDAKKVEVATSPLSNRLKEKVVNLTHQTSEYMKKTPDLSMDILEKARRELVEILAKEGEIIQKEGVEKSNFSFMEMFSEVKVNFKDFFSIFSNKDFRLSLFWVSLCVMLFSFWDTMAITYQPLFLREFAETNPSIKMFGGFLIVLFILPVFALQIPFARIADKIGREKIIILGLLISAIAVIFLSTTESVFVLILSGMAMGTGYAAAFAPAQAMFVSEFKKAKNIPESDSNKIAGSLRIALNVGNIFGQFLGGAVFASLGFRGGFLMFGVIFLILFIFSIVFHKKLKLFTKVQ